MRLSELTNPPRMWVKPYPHNNDVVVEIDVAKVDASVAKDPEFYVGPNGEGGIGQRYARFGEWLEGNAPVKMAEIGLNQQEEIYFTNGRHRFAWFRDHGAKTLPVAVPPEDAERMKALYGA